MAELTDVVKSISNNLASIFRHLLPGVLILSAAVAAFGPDNFKDTGIDVDITNGAWLIVLGVLATVIGNVWFVVHRYLVQQIVDWFFWLCKAQGGPKRGESKYGKGIATYVWDFFSSANVPEDVRKHVRFRTSSVILMYITAEVAFLAALLAEEGSILAPQRSWILRAAVVIFIAAIWQNYLIRQIEGSVAIGTKP